MHEAEGHVCNEDCALITSLTLRTKENILHHAEGRVDIAITVLLTAAAVFIAERDNLCLNDAMMALGAAAMLRAGAQVEMTRVPVPTITKGVMS